MILLSTQTLIKYLICGSNQNWLLNLNLIYDILWTGTGNGLLISILVSFDQSYNTGAIDVKMDGSVLDEKLSCKMLWLTFSSKLDWGSYIISIAETASKKIGALIRSRSFFLPRFLCIPTNLPYDHACNTVVVSGLVLLVPSWVSYKNGYAGVLVLYLLSFEPLSKCSQLKSFLSVLLWQMSI